MTRLTLGTVVVLLVGATAAVALARLFGRSDSRAAALVAVVSQWLGAWVLWNFAGGLALHYGLLDAYDGTLFAFLALAMGLVHYRTRLRAGRDQALAVFVGGQLLWLVVLALQNGVFSP